MELIEHLTAARDFLADCKSQKIYPEMLAAQGVAIRDTLQNATVDIAYAGRISNLIKSIGWDEDFVNEMLHILSTACTQKLAVITSANARIVLQDYRNIDQYFTKEEWELLLSNDAPTTVKLELIAGRAQQLRLRAATEPAWQRIAGLWLAASEGIDASLAQTAAIKHQAFCYVKKAVKARRSDTVGPAVLPDFDANPDVKLLQAVYGKNRCLPCQIPPVKFSSLTASIPMRGTNARVRPQQSPTCTFMGADPMAQFGSMMQAFMQQARGNYFQDKGIDLTVFPQKRRALGDTTSCHCFKSQKGPGLDEHDADEDKPIEVDGEATSGARVLELDTAKAPVPKTQSEIQAVTAPSSVADSAAKIIASMMTGNKKKAKKGGSSDGTPKAPPPVEHEESTDTEEVAPAKPKKKAEKNKGGAHYEKTSKAVVCFDAKGAKKKTITFASAGVPWGENV